MPSESLFFSGFIGTVFEDALTSLRLFSEAASWGLSPGGQITG